MLDKVNEDVSANFFVQVKINTWYIIRIINNDWKIQVLTSRKNPEAKHQANQLGWLVRCLLGSG